MESQEFPLPFPADHPAAYRVLKSEPIFDPARHLALEMPSETTDLIALGYRRDELTECASEFALSSAFRILSAEGVAAMREVCDLIYQNRNASAGTGVNRLGSYARGAGYRSRFIRDFCDSPELAEHISAIAGVSLGRHSVPAVACGINYAPDDLSRAIDSWHVDSVAFDIVMMVTDPGGLKGGEFQYFRGTKEEGQALLGINGEEGVDTALPEDRIATIPFPEAGFGFMQQGTHIFHRACRLLERAERITLIPSFEVLPASAPDATNSLNMADWDDPGICPELARFEIRRTTARLEQLLSSIELEDSPGSLSERINAALARLVSFSEKLGGKAQ